MSALETQFTCSHFKPGVTANTQLLRQKTKWCAEELGSSEAQSVSVWHMWIRSRKEEVCLSVEAAVCGEREGHNQLSHTSTQSRFNIIIRYLHQILSQWMQMWKSLDLWALTILTQSKKRSSQASNPQCHQETSPGLASLAAVGHCDRTPNFVSVATTFTRDENVKVH